MTAHIQWLDQPQQIMPVVSLDLWEEEELARACEGLLLRVEFDILSRGGWTGGTPAPEEDTAAEHHVTDGVDEPSSNPGEQDVPPAYEDAIEETEPVSDCPLRKSLPPLPPRPKVGGPQEGAPKEGQGEDGSQPVNTDRCSEEVARPSKFDDPNTGYTVSETGLLPTVEEKERDVLSFRGRLWRLFHKRQAAFR